MCSHDELVSTTVTSKEQKKKSKKTIQFMDNLKTKASVERLSGCSLCNSKLQERWANMAAVDIETQSRKLEFSDIPVSKNAGNYVDYEHKHKERSKNDDGIAGKDNEDEDSADEGNGAEDDDDYAGAEIDALLLGGAASIPTTSGTVCADIVSDAIKKLQRLLKQ